MRQVLCLLLFTVFASCLLEEDNNQETARQIIDQLKTEFAPDKRVAIWNVELDRKDQAKSVYTLRGETNLPEAKDNLIDSLDAAGIKLQDSIRMLPDLDQLEEKVFGLVNLSAANIRSNPKHSAELATQSTLGTPLNVLKKQDGWYLVQTPDGYLGWLDGGGLELKTREEMQEWFNAPRVVYLPDSGISYDPDNPEDVPVSDLMAGAILQNAGSQYGVTTVRYPDGREASIIDTELMDYEEWITSRRATDQNILFNAYQLRGRPYLWGGTSNRAMDCSGFTKTVYYLNGILLPRDASQQVHVGMPVETDTSTWKNLQAGDLLFFGRAATEEKGEKVTHVAIYVGDGKIIHASGRVREESLRRGDPSFTEYRLKSFLRARRILGSEGKNGVRALKNVPVYSEGIL